MDRRTFLKGAVVGAGAVATTKTANAKLLDRLPFASKQDMEDDWKFIYPPLK